jgi:hypothetical protein
LSRPKPRDLPPENQRIWRAWQDARQRDPSLTQADFAMTVWPQPRRGLVRRRAVKAGKKLAPFDESEILHRERQARARYLRLVFEGKRVPKTLNQRADTIGGDFNVVVGRGDKTKSFNVILPGGVSRIDAYKLIDSPEIKRLARKRAALWRKMYGAENVDDTPTEIRGVSHHSRPAEFFRKAV